VSEIVASLTRAFTLAFVITSMFGLGLGLTLRDIISPLRNLRLLLASLAANFLVVPAAAWALSRVLPLDPDLQVGLVIFSAVAGAPLVIKETQLARGDVRFAVSLVTLQVVATVIYLPFALPVLIPGIAVNTVSIAMPLILEILLPLGLSCSPALRPAGCWGDRNRRRAGRWRSAPPSATSPRRSSSTPAASRTDRR
jgi:BASS family bile acid:Na+ symporter